MRRGNEQCVHIERTDRTGLRRECERGGRMWRTEGPGRESELNVHLKRLLINVNSSAGDGAPFE